tara:strand:+ start:3507 stop:3704 length:198 start_codon:yes stop_codon:yes gene_type:complete
MKHTGQIYKFTGPIGLIRPDTFGQSRRDVLFNKHEHDLKIGDRVSYDHFEKNQRRYADNLQKLTT